MVQSVVTLSCKTERERQRVRRSVTILRHVSRPWSRERGGAEGAREGQGERMKERGREGRPDRGWEHVTKRGRPREANKERGGQATDRRRQGLMMRRKGQKETDQGGQGGGRKGLVAKG